MDEVLKERIRDIYKNNSIDRLSFFENVSPKKFKNAKNSYARELDSPNDDESVVCHFDDTLFGGAKEGFILTTKRLYFKNILCGRVVVDIGDIAGMYLLSKAIPEILIKSTDGDLSVHIITQNTSKKSQEILLYILDEIVKLLKERLPVKEEIQENAQIQKGGELTLTICKSCGAPNDISRKSCRYCHIKLS
ncbi:MAG: hypothetical protein FWG83_05790 [Oscillospiraceae bacterium]|nr:hypothetical protein [Oscillospiraceae bacterium]